MSSLQIPLFHGTSTIFLDGIIKNQLGGVNPILELDAYNFVKDLWPHVKAHLSDDSNFNARIGSFSRMVRQTTGPMNFQHGDTYLSPARSTAIRYASNKRYGSEILTYALGFLEELVRRDVEGIRNVLYRKYPQVFSLLDISPSPILIEVIDCPLDSLRTEAGVDAEFQISELMELWNEKRDLFEMVGQQKNFRLSRPVPIEKLKFWMLNVLKWDPFFPECQMIRIDLNDMRSSS